MNDLNKADNDDQAVAKIQPKISKPPEKKKRRSILLDIYMRNQTHVGNILSLIGIALAAPSIIALGLAYFTNLISIKSFLHLIFGPKLAFNSIAVFFSSGFGIAIILAGISFRAWKVSEKRGREKSFLIQGQLGKLEAYQKPEPHFRAWAQGNTTCDKELFDILFYDRIPDSSAPVPVSYVVKIIEQNMEDTIETASLILSAFTGTECSASFEALKPDEQIRDYTSWYLIGKSKWCDKRSRQERAVENRKTYLHQNYAYKEVIAERKRIYVRDDLSSDAQFKINTRPGWENQLNAIIVHVVDKLSPVPNDQIYPYTGVLVIDNKTGGLDLRTCEHYVKEFCHRLAIMQYRLEMVLDYGKAVNAVKKVSHGHYPDA